VQQPELAPVNHEVPANAFHENSLDGHKELATVNMEG
jgi:hypothetical protein